MGSGYVMNWVQVCHREHLETVCCARSYASGDGFVLVEEERKHVCPALPQHDLSSLNDAWQCLLEPSHIRNSGWWLCVMDSIHHFQYLTLLEVHEQRFNFREAQHVAQFGCHGKWCPQGNLRAPKYGPVWTRPGGQRRVIGYCIGIIQPSYPYIVPGVSRITRLFYKNHHRQTPRRIVRGFSSPGQPVFSPGRYTSIQANGWMSQVTSVLRMWLMVWALLLVFYRLIVL